MTRRRRRLAVLAVFGLAVAGLFVGGSVAIAGAVVLLLFAGYYLTGVRDVLEFADSGKGKLVVAGALAISVGALLVSFVLGIIVVAVMSGLVVGYLLLAARGSK
jgi:hypothetical protein